MSSIILLRMLIGWHFLYEGVVKVYNPDWSAFSYLATAQGPFDFLFSPLAQNSMINVVDTLNVLALLFAGISLILGVFEKKAALVAMVLLAMYYLAHPPFPGLQQLNVEGNYWFVNKNLIELMACAVLFQNPTGHNLGLRSLWKNNKKPTKIEEA